MASPISAKSAQAKLLECSTRPSEDTSPKRALVAPTSPTSQVAPVEPCGAGCSVDIAQRLRRLQWLRRSVAIAPALRAIATAFPLRFLFGAHNGIPPGSAEL